MLLLEKQNFKRIPGNGLHGILIYGLKLLPLWKQSFERGGGYIMTDYNKIAMDNLNGLMREIAEYSRMAEEIGATLDSLKDSLKKYMDENGLDSIAGNEHKASYKAVTSSRIDTTALKRDMPEIAAKYTKTTETRRFLFV
nr:MAG TPA: Exonuclease [Caudoviricetes sp.]